MIEFWNASDCAEALRIKGGARSFLQYTACLPDFPKPFEIKSKRTLKRTRLLWNKSDVINWVTGKN